MNYHSLRGFRIAPLLCFGLLTSLAGAQVAGISNFHKVNDRVYRGAQPTAEGFKTLAALGVKTVIDLRPASEHSQTQEAAWVESDGMRYVSIPLKGMSAPPDAKVAKILAILNDESAGPVFVHCRRGADRTGTVIACYRISHDHWDNRKALDEARSMGMSFFERSMQSYVARYRGSSPAQATVATQQ